MTTTLDEFKAVKELVQTTPNIHPSLGIFPLKVRDEIDSLEEILELIETEKFIGEIGLDYTAPEDERQQQRLVLKEIINKCNNAGKKVLSLHSRGSSQDVLKFIGSDFNGSAIMHWFSEILNLLKRPQKMSFFH